MSQPRVDRLPARSAPVIGSPEKFVALDGLRGVAALAVFARHVPDPTILNVLPAGYLGVDFFFVLSGFILTHAYSERLRGGMGVAEFMLRRYIRLWPFYLLGSLFGVAVALRDAWPPFSLISSILPALLLLPKPAREMGHQVAFPLNSPAWSLFFELAANAVFALLGRHLSLKNLSVVLVVGAALLIATWLHFGRLNVGATMHSLVGGGGRVVWSFFAGVAVYRLWRRWPAPATPPLVCAVLLVTMLAVNLEMLWALLGFPLLVYVAASAKPTGWTGAIFARLGVISYGFYAIHVPIIYLVGNHVPLNSLWATIVLALALMALVLVLDRWFDQPTRRWMETRLLRRRRGEAAVSRPASPVTSVTDA